MGDLSINRPQLAKLLALNSQAVCALKSGAKYKSPETGMKVAAKRLRESYDILLGIGGVHSVDLKKVANASQGG